MSTVSATRKCPLCHNSGPLVTSDGDIIPDNYIFKTPSCEHTFYCGNPACGFSEDVFREYADHDPSLQTSSKRPPAPVNLQFRATREFLKLQWRAEMFNAWNHTQFQQPNGNAGDGANFGRISATLPPRLIQLAMKLCW